ncbi:MAG: DNA topoisomerase, partial [Myxococcales bacterium]
PVVESLTQKQTREPPPQLFDLTSLQRTANRRYGFSATRTLEAAQALYERHKVLTYPRTDSRYLPQDLVGELPRLFAGLAKLPAYEEFAKPLLAGDAGALGRSRRIFDAAKVHDHHAIIPTGKVPAGGALGPDEQRLYDLVVRRFLGAFHPDAEFALTEAVIRVGLAAPDPLQADTTSGARAAPDHRGGNPAEAPAGVRARGAGEFGDEPMLGSLPLPPDRFIARGRVRLVAGWQAVAGFDERPGAGAGAGTIDQRDRRGGGGVGGGGRKEGSAATEPIEPLLPPLTKGQRLGGRFEALPHQTRPPPRHTEATLLGAMESAGREMEDEELRAAMKDTGLGTPATRAATIETLVKRGFIAREGKQVVPTAVGIDLIERLPVATLASPELTGAWEARLVRIARGDETRAAFMTDIAAYVSEVTAAVRAGMRARRAGTGEIARTAAPARVADRGDAATAVTPTKPSEKAAGKRAGKRVASAPGSGASARAPAMREKRAGGGAVALTCPRCRQGTLMAGNRGWGCSRWREGCPFVIWFEAAGKRITAGQLRDLVEKGRTRRFGQIGQIGQIGGAERMTKAPQGRLVLDLTASRESGGARFSPD